MVSRSPLGDATSDAHQDKTSQLPSNAVVKETQRGPKTLETPVHSKKDGQTVNRAQDVAELKDYVRIDTPRIEYPILTRC